MAMPDLHHSQDGLLHLRRMIKTSFAAYLPKANRLVRRFSFFGIFSLALLSFPIDALAVNAGTINGHACQALPIPIYGNDYNREVGSYEYLPLAIAAMNTYSNGEGKTVNFTLERYNDGWKREGHISNDTGMYADYYFKDGASLDVLIAFRGTVGAKDWFSNLSWITRVVPVDNEYDSARAAFETVAARAIARAGKGRCASSQQDIR
jgi:hypothetical protein